MHATQQRKARSDHVGFCFLLLLPTLYYENMGGTRFRENFYPSFLCNYEENESAYPPILSTGLNISLRWAGILLLLMVMAQEPDLKRARYGSRSGERIS